MPARNSQRDTAKAEYIKRRRAGEKINLKEFADRVGVPYGTVRNWKRIDQWDESLERKRGGDLARSQSGTSAAALDRRKVLAAHTGLVCQLAQPQAFACGHDFNVFFELHFVHFLSFT